VRKPRLNLPVTKAIATGDRSGRQERTSTPTPDRPRQANGMITSTPSPKHRSSSLLRNKLPPLPKDETKPPASARIPTERNNARLKLANEGDHNTMSKYLPSSLESFLMAPVVDPDDSFSPLSSFMNAIREVASTPAPVPKAPPIRFSTEPDALKHNAQLLQSHQYSMESLISQNNETTLAYGSEFRPIHQLKSILGKHSHFQQLLTILQEGMAFRFSRTLTEVKRAMELKQIVAQGNHKSAEDKPEAVAQLLSKDVTHGFSMPIPLHVVKLIPRALAQPLGMAKQITLYDAGKRIPNYRLTQDLSFSISQKRCSVNNRIDMDQYNEMIYRWCLSRIVHFIVALQYRFPGILMSKYDYSDAYRRIAHSASASTQSISVFKDIAAPVWSSIVSFLPLIRTYTRFSLFKWYGVQSPTYYQVLYSWMVRRMIFESSQLKNTEQALSKVWTLFSGWGYGGNLVTLSGLLVVFYYNKNFK
jgi:hypothetical protein